jgi:transcriptional regulator EpsA
VRLLEADWSRFSDAIEASFEVHSRPQFFVWTQSAVQGLLPHEILFCGVRDSGNQAMLFQHFSASRYFRQEHFDLVSHPHSGLLARLQAVSEESRQAVVFSPGDGDRTAQRVLDTLVESNEMQNLAAKLIVGIGGQAEAFYGFARVEAPFDVRLQRLIELLVPHIHSTFLRVLTQERVGATTHESRGTRIVTPRQAEILRLVRDGKTNAEIAELLECSQWTIKNHIHNSLKRLDTNSRAHALARAMRLGILRPD